VSTDLTITPSAGFNQGVTLTCSSAPSGASCTISPNSVTPDGKDAATATLSVTTTARSFTPVAPWAGPANHGNRWLFLWIAFLVGLALLAGLTRGRFRPRPLAGLALTASSLLVLVWAGCGGGNTGTGGGNPGTPAGTYSLTITATSGSLRHTTTVTLAVQ